MSKFQIGDRVKLTKEFTGELLKALDNKIGIIEGFVPKHTSGMAYKITFDREDEDSPYFTSIFPEIYLLPINSKS